MNDGRAYFGPFMAWLRPPPLGVLLVIGSFITLVPLYHWAIVGVREWAEGGSMAARLDGPYFWGILTFRIAGALLLACLLWGVRNPASIWITVTATWLTGPPLSMLYAAIVTLAVSVGQRSELGQFWSSLGWGSIFPLFVTICLLAPKKVRLSYGLSRENVPCERGGAS